MPKTTEQYKEIRKDKVILIQEVALELFTDLGYHSTSIALIAKKANISKGLLYNYFESKQALLKAIFYDVVADVVANLVAKSKSDLNNSSFIDNLFDDVIENPQKWKAFFQLGMQQEVMEIMMSENLSEKLLQYQELLFNYFVVHDFEDIQLSIMLFSSIYKGFALSYVFAPHLFDKAAIWSFKTRLKAEFERPKRNIPLKDVKIDEFMGYLLM